MKNWNDEGTVHYDASTDQSYTRVCLSFEHHRRRRVFNLAIPQSMRPALKGEHYDQAVLVAKRSIDEQLVKCAMAGEFETESMNRTADFMAWQAVLEHLYNQFHLSQASAGNNVWATPQRMQNVGPKPEDDPRPEDPDP